jgi:hypothetical protein
MNYYTNTTDYKLLELNYLYYEYESNQEVYYLNIEDLQNNPRTNITYNASI